MRISHGQVCIPCGLLAFESLTAILFFTLVILMFGIAVLFCLLVLTLLPLLWARGMTFNGDACTKTIPKYTFWGVYVVRDLKSFLTWGFVQIYTSSALWLVKEHFYGLKIFAAVYSINHCAYSMGLMIIDLLCCLNLIICLLSELLYWVNKCLFLVP